MEKFNPDVQSYCARNPLRCFSADTPSLRQVEQFYGRPIAESWLDVHISNFIKFTGVGGKEEFQRIIDDVLQVILDNFRWLKVSELMLFFQFCKAGKYGHFYGVVDAMVITEALQSFCTYRAEQLHRIEREREKEAERERERIRQEQAGELLTKEEWDELRWLFNLGYEAEGLQKNRKP